MLSKLSGSVVVSRRYNSSFIRHVMDHVKQEMEAAKKDPNASKDWQKLSEQADRLQQKVKNVQEKVSPTYSKARDMFDKVKSSAGPSSKIGADVPPTSSSPAMDKLRATLASVLEHERMKRAKDVLHSGVSKVVEKGQSFFARFDESPKEPELHAKWKAEQNAKKSTEEQAAPHPHEGALVVSETQQSAWERMGLGAESMPYLSETFGRILGESEIAQCTREMKSLDASFRLSFLIDEIERVVAPRFLEWFLAGNAAALKVHCGEAAFAAVNSSIKGRITQRCKPDERVLLGPKDIELRMAIPAEEANGSPCFVFGFHTQQVNCFRDMDGKIVEGGNDDIREIHYLLAVQRNLKEDQTGLQHPWLIRELAIVGNRRTW